ncbi:hypothetical protein FHS27_001948 [Rhodopirellula rubra]|uniref:Uncharacterized protein n=1 Tax=Aporhodopirellula rubra TaxID=980271 RepID=A0A7W5H5Q2_9BACT|nr:hypothetical protein [Aporhodopirellula rubra]MBB3206140.1 hypothetical protein [Aporhodopirellula rubra]
MDYVGLVLTRAGEWFEHWLASISTTEDDFVDEVAIVDFVGGPLDGYQHAVDVSRLYHLPPSILIPISVAMITRLSDTLEDGLSRDAGNDCDVPRSVASYDLVPHGPRWCYEFNGQFVTDDDNLSA